uniref:Actin filament associated protein 1 like 2 n=1 Tax=Rousettus aegyptiacus TaxID=9407 RepID=A0A7J8G3W4_ROUAE|nr:actin filament associated protein 1 like 2 [Rousettus aegyptiacus]
MERYKALEQLLTELEDFLKILDQENLSSTAVVRKSGLAELLRLYTKSSSSDEEYIYMNKVTVTKQQDAESQDKAPEEQSPLTNGEPSQHSSAPQKSLPDLPPPKMIPEREQLSIPKIESPEGYYEEAEPYDMSLNEDGEAVSSSYESYDEEEGSRGKSAPYQWPSPEASIELMRDTRICAFLWRKKWLGQWAKQLCVIKDTRLLCYKSSKDHSPQLDVNLLGSSVVHKEKQVRKKEHKLKITPMNADVIVLGLLSESGSKTDPEEFTYDYVDADRVSCIVSAAKTSLLLMQRKFSEPNTYIDGLPSQGRQELLYDDVEMSELTATVDPEEAPPPTDAQAESDPDRVYLDLTPVKSFLHSPGGTQIRARSPTPPHLDLPAEALPADAGLAPDELLIKSAETPELQPVQQESLEPSPRIATVKIQTEQQKISFPPSCPDVVAISPAGASTPVKDRLRVASAEIKLGKNRTEAEVKRYTEEKERLEKKREEIRAHLAQLRKQKRELKETLLKCTDKGVLASMEQKLKEIDEECKIEESRRVDLELNIVEVKGNLKKAEAGPVTLGTAVDTTHLESVGPRPKAAAPTPDCTPVNSATALKNRPLSVMVTGKGTVLQKAKEWEKKGTS